MALAPVRALSDFLDAFTTNQGELLDAAGRAVQGWLAGRVQGVGRVGQATKNALNGVWLGHPLHPALTDVPIGAWFVSLLLDLLGFDRSADIALNVGTLAAVPTAIAGAADYIDASDKPRRLGLIHAVLNVGALGLYLVSMRARVSGQRAFGVCLSAAGFAMASLSAWVGGELVYREGASVDRNAWLPAVPEFQVAAQAAALEEGKLASGSVNVDGQVIRLVLLKRGDQVYALSNACSHWGGPLAEGKLVDGDCIECPWHASRFDMRDGSVRQSPASAPARVFETRIRDGQVQVRSRRLD